MSRSMRRRKRATSSCVNAGVRPALRKYANMQVKTPQSQLFSCCGASATTSQRHSLAINGIIGNLSRASSPK